jgi:predicted  nucleic acid-binding Zn-ribbon protein
MVTTQTGLESKVREAVKLLTELQEIDDELREIGYERGDLPEEVNRLSEKIRDYERFIAERKAELEHAEKEIKSRTDQLSDAKAKLDKFQQQLYTVKTTREYDAITAESNFAKRDISDAESAITTQSQRKLELEKQLVERSSEIEHVKAEEQTKGAELRARLAETEGAERQLLHRRENIVVRLEKTVYNHYERIRKAKDGRGVARIFGGACGGCFAVIPPQIQANIRQQTDIMLCETCGRILVP